MDIEKLVWSSWRPLKVACERWEPAVYQMRMMTGAEPKQINRFRGTDQGGLLTIGQTTSMEQRRLNFLTAINKCRGHSAGNLLFLLLNYCNMGPSVTTECIQYRYVELASEMDAMHAEALLVRAYILKHCEPPPLNSAIPDRYGNKYGEWQAITD
jgi:hypothetical protein